MSVATLSNLVVSAAVEESMLSILTPNVVVSVATALNLVVNVTVELSRLFSRAAIVL